MKARAFCPFYAANSAASLIKQILKPMNGKENYQELRDKAIIWLNGKRDFITGLAILQTSGYRPAITSKIAKWGTKNAFAQEKLVYEIRQFIKAWVSPESFDDIPEETLPDAEEPNETTIQTEMNKEGYPTVIRRCYHEFYELMKQRRILHQDLTEITTNDSENIWRRKMLCTSIETISARMDALWSAIDRYQRDKTLPDDILFNPKLEDLEMPEPVLPEDLEKLKSIRKNTGIKLLKAKNMLLYQSEKKGVKENLMPDGPKRAKYEKKISELSELIEKVGYKIVELS